MSSRLQYIAGDDFMCSTPVVVSWHHDVPLLVIRHGANAGTFQQAAGSASSGLGNFDTGLNLPDTEFTACCLEDLAAFKN